MSADEGGKSLLSNRLAQGELWGTVLQHNEETLPISCMTTTVYIAAIEK